MKLFTRRYYAQHEVAALLKINAGAVKGAVDHKKLKWSGKTARSNGTSHGGRRARLFTAQEIIDYIEYRKWYFSPARHLKKSKLKPKIDVVPIRCDEIAKAERELIRRAKREHGEFRKLRPWQKKAALAKQERWIKRGWGK